MEIWIVMGCDSTIGADCWVEKVFWSMKEAEDYVGSDISLWTELHVIHGHPPEEFK